MAQGSQDELLAAAGTLVRAADRAALEGGADRRRHRRRPGAAGALVADAEPEAVGRAAAAAAVVLSSCAAADGGRPRGAVPVADRHRRRPTGRDRPGRPAGPGGPGMSSTVLTPAGERPRTQPAPAPPSLLQLVRVELRKALRHPGRLLAAAGDRGRGRRRRPAGPGSSTTTPTKSFGNYFGPSQFPVGLLLPVLGILLVTSEWSQRTALTTFTLVPRRLPGAAAKVLAATSLALLGVAAAAVASALGDGAHAGARGLVVQGDAVRSPARARSSSSRSSPSWSGSRSACCC